MTCTHDCNQGRTCTCAASNSDEAGLWIRIPDLIMIMTVMVTIGVIVGVQLVRMGMASSLSDNDLQARQHLQSGRISSPIGRAIGGHTPVVVEVDRLQVFSPLEVNLPGFGLGQTFEFDPDRVVLVLNPICARDAHRLVSPVGHDIAPILLPHQAIRQEHPSEL